MTKRKTKASAEAVEPSKLDRTMNRQRNAAMMAAMRATRAKKKTTTAVVELGTQLDPCSEVAWRSAGKA